MKYILLMKRLLTFLVLLLSFLLTGCHLSVSDLSTNPENTELETQNEPEKIIIPMENLPLYNYTTQEITVKNNDQNIYGIAYIPETPDPKKPLVILSHGLGGSYQDGYGYADALASRGIAVYSFDFRGGGGNASDGKTTEMSVLTEVSDLETVLHNAENWSFVDKEKIVLLGASQGGLVSAITAADYPDQVAGLILTYPAFNIPDAVHQLVDSPDIIPETYSFGWITLGRIYAQDIWDLDVYEQIKKYDKKVLLLHGNEDPLVPLSYSEQAIEVYPNADFFIIEGAEHGFYGDNFQKSLNYVFDYLQQIDII